MVQQTFIDILFHFISGKDQKYSIAPLEFIQMAKNP